MERWRVQPGAGMLAVERRADGQDDDEEKMRLRGYATVYDTLTEPIWDLWRERVAMGAYDESVARDDIRCLWQHDSTKVLGRTASGTMRVWSDDVGVGYSAEPPAWASGYMESVARGDVTQSSIGFEAFEDEWAMDPEDDERYIRTIVKAKMWEGSPVTWPALSATSVGLAGAQRGGGLFGQLPQLPAQMRWGEEAGRLRIVRQAQSPGVDLMAARALAMRAATAAAEVERALLGGDFQALAGGRGGVR